MSARAAFRFTPLGRIPRALLGIACGVILFCGEGAGVAQQKPASPELDQVTRDIADWVRENVDDSFLGVLGDVDHERVQKLLGDLVAKFDANDVYDLATAREAAIRFVPILKQFEETKPYAIWLETQLDYLEVSESLRRAIQPVPPKAGEPPKRLPPPTAEAQRKAWDARLAGRAWPAQAKELVPRLKPIFREAGIPAELVWLAEVESSFEPSARSPKGAAGLYQLMPATARSLGLSTWPIDERLKAEENSRAASKYLRYLYGRFGDWRLALAAFNAGEGRVSNLLADAKPRSFSAIASRLPSETQLYVPRFDATLRKREAVSLANLGPPRIDLKPAP